MVPAPGALITLSWPPTEPMRSCMLTKPWPRRRRGGVEAGAVVGDLDSTSGSSVAGHPERDGGAVAGVLAGVLHRLEAAEVDRRLDLAGVAADPSTSTVIGRRPGRRPPAAPRGRPPDTSSGGKMPWASARSSWMASCTSASQLVDHRRRVGRVVLDELAGQAAA